jgi:hypothetical protein
MARIRSIHPGLFTDELFAGLSMAARVLLLGLWTEADDQGVFDWKPVTLKMRLMPVDNVDVPSLLLELEQADLIRRFEQDARGFGAIRNFCKYQRPKTPKYRDLKSADLRNYVASKYPITETTGPEPAPFPKKVEMSPQMEEGGDKREEVKESTQPIAKATAECSRFEEFWKDYPKRDGDNPRKPAEKKFNALVKTGVDPEVMISGARQASADARARGIYSTKYVPQAIKWLNDQRFHDYAVAAASSSSSEEVNWDAICLTYKKLGLWSKHAPGNGPDSPSCQCPRDILAKHGIPFVSSSSADPQPVPALRTMQ